jgi:hypothetical protein
MRIWIILLALFVNVLACCKSDKKHDKKDEISSSHINEKK